MVAKAKEMLEQELIDKEEEKERYLTEKVPPLQTGGMPFAELQVIPVRTLTYTQLNKLSELNWISTTWSEVLWITNTVSAKKSS